MGKIIPGKQPCHSAAEWVCQIATALEELQDFKGFENVWNSGPCDEEYFLKTQCNYSIERRAVFKKDVRGL